MSDSEMISILNKFSDVLEINSAWVWPFKWIGWTLIQMLSSLVELVSGVADQLFVLDTFYKNSEVIAFIDSFKSVIWVLFALSLVGVGYRIMFTKNKDFQSVVINFAIALSVIVALPVAMDKMMDITRAGVNFVNTDSLGQEENYADKIIKDNVTDVLLYEKNGFSTLELSKPNNIPIKNIRGISATDSIDPDDIESDYKEVFENKLSIGTDGTMELVEMNQGATDIFKEYYGRYKISYFYIIISLAVVAATQVFTSLKLGRLIFELAYNQLLALIVAPLDISSGQRLKKIIENIISIFFVTILISALLKFYIMFVSVASDMGGVAGVILLIAGSFAVIDGPNIVDKLFGIDAGIQSGFKMIAGTYATLKGVGMGAKAMGSLASTGASAVGGAANVAAGGLGGLGGLGKGIRDGINSDSNKGQSRGQDSGNSENKGSSEDDGSASTNKGEGIYSSMEKEDSEVTDSSNQAEDERPPSLYEEMETNDSEEKSTDTSPKNSMGESAIQRPNIQRADSDTSPSGNISKLSEDNKAISTGNSSNIERPSTEGASTPSPISSTGGASTPSPTSSVGQTPIGGNTGGVGQTGEPKSGSSEINRPSISNETKPIESSGSAKPEVGIQRPTQTNQNPIGGLSEPQKNATGDMESQNVSRPPIQETESVSNSIADIGQGQSSMNSTHSIESPVSEAVQKPAAGKETPVETVKEARTIEQALGEAVKSKMKSSRQYKTLMKSYELSHNTGKKIGEKIK